MANLIFFSFFFGGGDGEKNARKGDNLPGGATAYFEPRPHARVRTT